MLEGFEVPEELVNQLVAGDERCKYAIGDKVVKATYEKGDHHEIGSKGTIRGSIQIPIPSGNKDTTDAYLVSFDQDGEDIVAFIIEDKLMAENEFQSPS